jgi:hypothetical protein
MKTFSQFLDEALASFLVKAAARSIFRNKALTQKVAKSVIKPSAINKVGAPQYLKFRKLYHGTTKPASQEISKSGWRTDTNVTRQMQGSGVYTTPQKSVAQIYSRQRALERGEDPAIRTFALPTSKFNQVKSSRERAGNWTFDKGGNKFNTIQMSPQAANKYDITDKPRSAVDLTNTQRKELADRVKAALKRPANTKALKKELGIKPELNVTRVPSVASSNLYRNLGAGRRESVREGKSFSQFMNESRVLCAT